MNKTSIEWVRNPDGSQGYTWNPITGCLNHDNGLCKGGGFPCYAYKLANGRVKPLYLANHNIPPAVPSEPFMVNEGMIHTSPIYSSVAQVDPFYPRFWEERLYHAWDGKPKGIFVCDMGDLFGIGIPEEWTNKVLNLCRLHEQNRYYLLTKQPQNLIKFSPFPDNCWVGVTATKFEAVIEATKWLHGVEASVKYLSLEPLLDWQTYNEKDLPWRLWKHAGINQLIIGACTGTLTDIVRLCDKYPDLAGVRYGNKWTAQPSIEWVKEIVEAADKTGIPVFLKDNLEPLLDSALTIREREELRIGLPGNIRQELPDG